MNDIANAIGQYLLDLLGKIGLITFIDDEFVTPLGYFILVILIFIIMFSFRKLLSRAK